MIADISTHAGLRLRSHMQVYVPDDSGYIAYVPDDSGYIHTCMFTFPMIADIATHAGLRSR